MDGHGHKHEWIRFRRGDIAALHTMPSHGEAALPSRRGWRGHLRLYAVLAGSIVALAAVLALAAGLAINAGFGLTQIDAAADRQLSALFERPVDARFSRPRISFAGIGRLAVAVSDASLLSETGGPIGRADDLRFTFSIPALFSGRVELTGARASGAAIDLEALGIAGSGEGGDPAALLTDPDRLNTMAFAAAAELAKGLERAGATNLGLRNVDLTWGKGDGQRARIDAFELKRKGRNLGVSAKLTYAGGGYGINGSSTLGADDAVTGLDLALDLPAHGEEGGMLRVAAARVRLSGSQSDVPRIVLSVDPVEITLNDRDVGPIVAVVSGEIGIKSGAGGIGFRAVTAEFGRNRLVFTGAAEPVTGTDGARTYRFELASDQSVLAPADSPEAALPVTIKAKGAWNPGAGTLSVDDFGVRTNGGEVVGTASLTFTGAASPAAYLAIRVPGMPVPHAKQVWPAPSAPTAREWVLTNLFGGNVTAGSLELKAGPGRLAEGNLTGEEISGHFRVEGARFDIAGDLPPMRDAIGEIDFAGNDVHITLESGTAFLPTGKAVSASNGVFDIPKADVRPVIGKLKIAVAGNADAVAELSSYRPINALKNIPFAPADLAGTVAGTVVADIPLSKTEGDYLPAFEVTLDYKDLSIARPFDGQKVTDADGRIVVDPRKAVVSADARLNGMPAHIDLIEPLGDKTAKRVQKIDFVFDEKAQKALSPGLSSLVEGTFTVEIDASAQGQQSARADLTKARIDLPWVGWSKGAGIPAEATFTIGAGKDGTTSISGFRLSGKSFLIAGDLAVKNDTLVSARLDQVRLNAADQKVSANIKSVGKGYDVRVQGASFDGRALVRDVLSDPVQAGSTIGTTPVTLSAKLDSALGFNDERLSGVSLTYSGTGKMIGKLAIKATTAGGGEVSMTNASEGEARKVRMDSGDAGAILRFLNIYEHMRGGSIALALAGGATGALQGEIDARNFEVVNEPRLKSLVSSRPSADTPSLSEAVKQDIDTSVVKFERGYSQITKGRGLLKIDNGILRGPLIGFTFQGTFYDPNNKMALTGTMMPAYGLNRIFAEIPLVGVILGNGRDKGLLGITFKLSGKAGDPTLTVNPISLIAPGIFRSIFEFKKG